MAPTIGFRLVLLTGLALAGSLAAISWRGDGARTPEGMSGAPRVTAACRPLLVAPEGGAGVVVCGDHPVSIAAALDAAAIAVGCGRPPVAVAGQAGERLVVTGRDGACALRRENAGAAARLALGLPLLVDRADERDLVLLPGVSRERARAIVEARGSAPFVAVEDLLRVRGIGPRRLAALRGLVEVGTAAAAGSREGVGEPTGRARAGTAAP